MPPTTAQRSVINQFIAITGAQERIASSLLKKHAWKLDQACDAYFTQAAVSPANEKAEASLIKLFEKYRDTTNDEKDAIGVDGTMTYLTELGINLEDASSLIPLEIVQAPSLGEITKEGFVSGWRKAGQESRTTIETIPKQKSYIATQTPLLSTDLSLFKRVYKHTFICSKEKGQKAIPLENAIVYWEMLFAPPGMGWATSSTNWLDLWIQYLKEKWTKSVNKDMWNQTFEFFQKTMHDDSLSFWSEDGAWPGVIDDFVAYVKEKRGNGGQDKMETD